jgi:4-hydroxy-tetrahydrodipicolinate reductase
MGREVERVLGQRGHEVAGRVDPADAEADAKSVTPELLAESDAVIEFSLKEAVLDNARAYAKAGTPAAVGTTGWASDKEAVVETVKAAGTGYVAGANFSVGAHLFFALAAQAAKLIGEIPDYDIAAFEVHHRRKADSPSGTALTLAARIQENLPRKKRVVTDKLSRRIEPDELHVASIRGGEIPGIHTVLVDSAFDTIEITHRARSRGGFAFGAVLAAEWVREKRGFFDVEDFVKDILPE